MLRTEITLFCVIQKTNAHDVQVLFASIFHRNIGMNLPDSCVCHNQITHHNLETEIYLLHFRSIRLASATRFNNFKTVTVI